MLLSDIVQFIFNSFAKFFIASIVFMSCVFAQTSDFTVSRQAFGMFRNFASGMTELFEQFKLSSYDINLNNNDTDVLIVHGFGTTNYSSDNSVFSMDTDTIDSDQASLVSDPLVYPNPFRQSATTCQSGYNGENNCARLVYELAEEGPIEIQMYDMLSNLIFKRDFVSGSIGAMLGQNELIFDYTTFENSVSGEYYSLSVGVYFYLIMSNGEVIGKGKMVVKP